MGRSAAVGLGDHTGMGQPEPPPSLRDPTTVR